MEVLQDLKGKDFLKLADFTSEQIMAMLDLAAAMKKGDYQAKPLTGKTIGLIFQKSSTRTRVSFEVGALQLGGYPLFLSANDLQIGRGETVHDTAKTLSRYLDGIMIRAHAHAQVEELAEHATIPVINGLTDSYHPCQVLADLQAVRENKSKLQGVKLAYIGDGNNMAHSLMIGCAKVGMTIAVASPKGYEPEQAITDQARTIAKEFATINKTELAEIIVTNQPADAVKGADVVYTDVWASMGQEAEQDERLQKFTGFQVDDNLCSLAKPDYIFMHCLPAHRGEEVTAALIDGEHSIVFDQAENRLHAQKAIMATVMG